MRLTRTLALAAVALAAAVSNAFGQNAWPTPDGRTAATGTVNMCLNATNQAVPCSSTAGVAVSPTAYPLGAVPITNSATGTTNATAATLAGAANVTTYICGLSIRANATAAATGNATVAGTISGTMNFTQFTAVNTAGIGTIELDLTPCIPASAVNTAIVVTSAAPGAGGVVSVAAWGYRL